MSLAASLATYSQKVNQTLESFFASQENEKVVSDNAALKTSLSLLHDFSLRGGKAIRPFLVKTAFDLAGGQSNPGLIKAAAAIDLHHKHILILDDIADRDEERYGGPTLEWAYKKEFAKYKDGEHRARTFAMLDAVWLGALARQLLAESHFSSKKLLACQKILNTLMFRDTLAGWQIHALECDHEISEVSMEEFVKGLELVTARYTFEGPLKIGLALAGNKDQKLTEALTLYSEKVGTAFQIHDDILGLFGKTEKTGKPVGNDVREGKKTLLVQMAYQRAGKNDREFLEKAVGNIILTTQDLTKVQLLVKELGALKHSQTMATQMVSEGITALAPLRISPSKDLLVKLAEHVITRDK